VLKYILLDGPFFPNSLSQTQWDEKHQNQSLENVFHIQMIFTLL